MATEVHVKLDERSYPIRIGAAPSLELPASWAGARALMVSDATVDALHGEAWQERLRGAGLRVSRVVVPAGEPSKSLEQAGLLYAAAAAAGLERRSVVVALGGGMVGDLAGFVAATYQRGVHLLQIPTTLLAMVDSAVGGKTAVNIEAGKNLVGAFYQPGLVVADIGMLTTLPEREYRSGLAEVVKYGVIWDAKLFGALEAEVEALLARDAATLERVIARCCEIKAEVIAVDERDLGVRAILNFGHTLAHAIEQASGYGRWLHGEAVAVGMAYASALSVGLRALGEADGARVIGLLSRLGLPVTAAEVGMDGQWVRLRAAMTGDKKSRDGQPRFVLADRLGAVVFDCEVEDGALAATFAGMTETVAAWRRDG